MYWTGIDRYGTSSAFCTQQFEVSLKAWQQFNLQFFTLNSRGQDLQVKHLSHLF